MTIHRPSDMIVAMRWSTLHAARRLDVSTKAIFLFRNNRNMLASDKIALLRQHFDKWRNRRPVASFS